MRSSTAYEKVFSSKNELLIWPNIAKVLKMTDIHLEKLRPARTSASERFLKNWRQLVCFLTVSKLIGEFNFSQKHLIEFDYNLLTEDEIKQTWSDICIFGEKNFTKNWISGWRNKEFVINLCNEYSEKYQLGVIARIEKTSLSTNNWRGKTSQANFEPITLEFALLINEALPPQPWKPGVHYEVMKKVNCTKRQYFESVKLLIEKGIRNHQKDGVVYDQDGNVLYFDVERVNPETLKLIEVENF
jgi:hypothetical protein